MANSTAKNPWLWILFIVLAILGTLVGSTIYTVTKLVGSNGTKKLDKSSGIFDSSKNQIAVVHIEGVIEEKKSQQIQESLDEFGDDDDVKAVVIRVSSPGGAVGPSQELFRAIQRLSKLKHKKVVCSFGDIAASGGVYLAMGCEKIYSNPGTLTGSIGVIMQFMNLKGVYNWVKVEPYLLKAGKFKDIGSDQRPMTDDERQLLQNMLTETHQQFKNAVLEGRPALTSEALDRFADGRILSGEQAKELKLVDELGGEYDALEGAAKLAGIKKYKVVRERFEKKSFRALFTDDSQSSAPLPTSMTDLPSLLKGLAQSLGNQARLSLQPGVPYYLPEFLLKQ